MLKALYFSNGYSLATIRASSIVCNRWSELVRLKFRSHMIILLPVVLYKHLALNAYFRSWRERGERGGEGERERRTEGVGHLLLKFPHFRITQVG